MRPRGSKAVHSLVDNWRTSPFSRPHTGQEATERFVAWLKRRAVIRDRLDKIRKYHKK